MAAVPVDNTALTGWFKELYDSMWRDAVPNFAIMYKLAKFKQASVLGEAFHVAVKVSNSQGVTYAAPNSGVYTLKDPIALNTGDATVNGYSMTFRDQIATQQLRRAKTSKAAFGSVVGLVVEGLKSSAHKRIELECLYGGNGIGLGTTSTSVNTDTTTTVVTFTAASWSPGIWAGMENSKVNFYNSTTLISSGADSIFTISAVNIADRKLTVTGTATGIAALDTAAQATSAALTIYFDGQYNNTAPGLDYALSTSGTVWGINNSTYSLWKGNTQAVGADLTLKKLFTYLEAPIAKGLDEDCTCLLSTKVWADLCSDEAAYRRYNGSYTSSQFFNGAEALTFHTQTGKIELIGHPYVKLGDGFVFPTKEVCRIGASDISFTNANGDENYLFALEDKEGCEIRAYTDQAFFLYTPAKGLKMTGITVS